MFVCRGTLLVKPFTMSTWDETVVVAVNEESRTLDIADVTTGHETVGNEIGDGLSQQIRYNATN